MALAIIAEAVLRIEHKLDAILRHLLVPMPLPMHFSGSMCPACGQLVDYQIDFKNQVVVRRCGCKTGKIPSAIPMLPVPEEHHVSGREDPITQDDS
jgi:hypothetical protein